jgi:hypothetical protein
MVKSALVAAAKADQSDQKGRRIARSLGLSDCTTF